MMKLTVSIATLALTLSIFQAEAAPDPARCPMHERHMKAAADTATATSEQSAVPMGDAKHGAEVDGRHDALVASHETTRHSFRLFADGGAIELRAADPADKATVDGVRAHLHEIAAQFVKHDFSTPAFVHGRVPAGVAGMQRLHDAITFRYQSVDAGGRIRITTANPDALAAIHEFLKFQVVEHRTDNTGNVEADD